jgi:hypothetical protein
MHLFKEHGVRDHQAAAGQIPVIDYGPYFSGASEALERVAGEVAHLWADRFDGSLEDVFELQDRVANSVAEVMEPTLQATEIHRSAQRSMNDTTTYDLYRRALSDHLSFDPQQIDRHRQTLKLCKKPLSQVIIAPRAQTSRRCETQAPLRRQAAKLCYRFGPLTPSAGSANLIAGDGRRTAFPLGTKNRQQTKNDYLTGKAPYRFESRILRPGVRCEPGGR